MKPWIAQIRREFWEYRSLWMVPLLAAAISLCSTVALAIRMSDLQYGPNGMFRYNQTFGAPPGTDPLTVVVFVFSALIYGLGALAVAAYAFDCLYAERRDRSILFWKSLPVSDARTVLSKVAVALVVMPVLLTVLAIVTNLLCGAILSISPSPGSPVRTMWDIGRLLHAYGNLAGVTLVNVLWYAPLVAYAMLASVLSPKLPGVTGLVPPIVVVIVEKIVFDSSHALAWIGSRIATVYDVGRVLPSPQLWGGVVAAGLVIAVVIRLRRWRDDS